MLYRRRTGRHTPPRRAQRCRRSANTASVRQPREAANAPPRPRARSNHSHTVTAEHDLDALVANLDGRDVAAVGGLRGRTEIAPRRAIDPVVHPALDPLRQHLLCEPVTVAL